MCIHARPFSNGYATDTVDLIDCLSSSIWRTVLIDFHLNPLRRRFTALTAPGVRPSHPPTTEDLVASWSAIDKALSHSNYDRVTKVTISCNRYKIRAQALPPGYRCTKDLFAKLLPEQNKRGRLQVVCSPGAPDKTCAYHRYAPVRMIRIAVYTLSCRISREHESIGSTSIGALTKRDCIVM